MNGSRTIQFTPKGGALGAGKGATTPLMVKSVLFSTNDCYKSGGHWHVSLKAHLKYSKERTA